MRNWRLFKNQKTPQKTDAFFSKEVASLQILFSSTNGVLQINSSMHRWKAIKFSKNPKAVKYFVYVLSIIPRTARASEGLNIYITSRLLHIIELDTAKLRTKLLYRFIFSSNENPRLWNIPKNRQPVKIWGDSCFPQAPGAAKIAYSEIASTKTKFFAPFLWQYNNYCITFSEKNS